MLIIASRRLTKSLYDSFFGIFIHTNLFVHQLYKFYKL
jgi:hypothetical protein